MAGTAVLWDGDDLGEQKVALVAFSRPSQGGSLQSVPLFAVASTGPMTVLLLPAQFSSFLRRHQNAILVCNDAAALHWLLEGHFRRSNDRESLQVLWAYSQESRLIDIMPLDQHVRRCQGEDGTVASPLHRLLRRRAGVELPDNQEIERRVAAAWGKMHQSPNDPVLELVSAVAAGILRTYERLLAEATSIADAVEQANQLPVVEEPPPPDAAEIEAEMDRVMGIVEKRRLASSTAPSETEATIPATAENPAAPFARSFGPLGIGIDVQAAIALGRPDRPALHLDSEQLDELRRMNDDRYRGASARLHGDTGAHSCFEWKKGSPGENLVARDKNGLPVYRRRQFKAWLQKTAKGLCDIHNMPAAIPQTLQGDLSSDPEQWDIWAGCQRSLQAWRDLERSAQLESHVTHTSIMRPTFDVVPVLKSRAPNLVAVRSLGIPNFRPDAGHLFVIGTIPHLTVHCFAAVHQGDRHFPRNRLVGYFLEEKNPISKIAGELYALAEGGFVPAAENEAEYIKRDQPSPSFESLTDRFADFEKGNPDIYWHWLEMTAILLEVMPLALPESLLGVLLEADYGLDVIKGSEITRLFGLLWGQVIYGIEDYLSGDVLRRLSPVLGLTPGKGVDLLAERKHVGTTDAALRNDLLQKREGSPLWQFIRRARHEGTIAGFPTDDEIIEKVLHRCGWTAAGRVIKSAHHLELRRQQVRLFADEVMKSIAYSLVAHGHNLTAVDGNQFVLEVPEADANKETLKAIASLTANGGRRILGRFAPGCHCRPAACWQ